LLPELLLLILVLPLPPVFAIPRALALALFGILPHPIVPHPLLFFVLLVIPLPLLIDLLRPVVLEPQVAVLLLGKLLHLVVGIFPFLFVIPFLHFLNFLWLLG
jgi:hypothetical protein